MNFLQTIQKYSADLVRMGRSFVFQASSSLYSCTVTDGGLCFYHLSDNYGCWQKRHPGSTVRYGDDSALADYKITDVEVIRLRYKNGLGAPTIKFILEYDYDKGS